MKRTAWIGVLGLMLTACSPALRAVPSVTRPDGVTAPAPKNTTPAASPEATAVPRQEATVQLPDGPLAPALNNDTWLNSKPLLTADLRGRVVLIDFWTFG